MTNLPIPSSNALPSAKGAPGDASAARNDPSGATDSAAARTSPASQDPAAEPFAVLLARQIDGGLQAGPDTANVAAVTGAKPAEQAGATEKVAHDQTAADAGTQPDQANPLAAMLLLPIAESKQAVNTPPATQNSTLQQKIDDRLLSQSSAKSAAQNSVEKNGAFLKTAEVKSSPLLHQAADAAGHVAMASESVPHPTAMHSDNSKTPIPNGATAVATGVPANNNVANAAQTVSTPVGNSGWADDFSQKIVWMGNQNNQSAELHLNPPDLGPLNVVIRMTDNQLTAQFTSPHSAVRDAVENALPKLREVLADNNIMLGNATVSDQSRNQGGQDSFNQNTGGSAQRDASYGSLEPGTSMSATVQSLPVRRHNGMLDTFA